MNDLPEKTLLTPEEIARFFTVDKRTIYNWCDEGKLKWCKPNGIIRIYRISVVELLQQKSGEKITEERLEKPKPAQAQPKRKPAGWIKRW